MDRIGLLIGDGLHGMVAPVSVHTMGIPHMAMVDTTAVTGTAIMPDYMEIMVMVIMVIEVMLAMDRGTHYGRLLRVQ